MKFLYHLLEISRVVDCGLFYDAVTVLGYIAIYTGHFSLQVSVPDYSLSYFATTSPLNGRRPDDHQV
jgi:hypothetical protein